MGVNIINLFVPDQSPHWDHSLPLNKLLDQAKLFLLRRSDPHGDLVEVILEESPTGYLCTSLRHDRHGVTYAADGFLAKEYAEEMIRENNALLTTQQLIALLYIGDVMHSVNTDHYFSTPLSNG